MAAPARALDFIADLIINLFKKMPNIIQKPSPNFIAGRGAYKPQMVVIHVMAGTLAGTDSWFASTVSQVSAHYGVGLSGEIHQYVQEENQAWHAGRVSNPSFKLYIPNVNPNLYTIGIEHEGIDLSKNPESQLEASAALLKDICTRNSIPLDRDHVIGHYQLFDQKPNCPATDKTVIDKIIALAQAIADPMVSVQVPQSKVDRVLAFIKTI